MAADDGGGTGQQPTARRQGARGMAARMAVMARKVVEQLAEATREEERKGTPAAMATGGGAVTAAKRG